VPAVYQRPPPPATRSFRAADDEISILVTVVTLQPREFVPASRRSRRALLGGVGPILGAMGMKTGSFRALTHRSQ
jgi:hypothetical protein